LNLLVKSINNFLQTSLSSFSAKSGLKIIFNHKRAAQEISYRALILYPPPTRPTHPTLSQGRFHQKFVARRKVASAQCLSKNSLFNFANIFSLTGHKIMAHNIVSFLLNAVGCWPNLCAKRSISS
jgi:hypothetical protein